MKKTDKRKWRIIYPLFFVIISALLVYVIVEQNSSRDQVKVKTYRVANGWGYKITVKDRVIINQPFIPVLAGTDPFPTRRSAYRAGQIVKKKLINKQLPMLSIKDLEEIGLISLEGSN